MTTKEEVTAMQNEMRNLTEHLAYFKELYQDALTGLETVVTERDFARECMGKLYASIEKLTTERDAMRLERDTAIGQWQAVWHMLEAEPSYVAREAELNTACDYWDLQHPEWSDTADNAPAGHCWH